MRHLNILFLGLILATTACQPEGIDDSMRMEKKVMALELAVLEDDKANSFLYCNELLIMLDEEAELYNTPGHKVKPVEEILESILENNYDHRRKEVISHLKSIYLQNIYEEGQNGQFLPIFWVFGSDLLEATNTGMDPLMDLYEWNEFSGQVSCLQESWKLLNLHKPDFEILNFNEENVEAYAKKLSVLNASMESLIKGMENIKYEGQGIYFLSEDLYNSYLDLLRFIIFPLRKDQDQFLS